MEEFKNYVRTKSLFDLFNECTDKEIVNFFNSKKNPITVIDADNMVRILKPESLLLAVAPFKWNYHEHPIDFWRFSPKGLEYLFARTLKMTTLHLGFYGSGDSLSLYIGIKHGI